MREVRAAAQCANILNGAAPLRPKGTLVRLKLMKWLLLISVCGIAACGGGNPESESTTLSVLRVGVLPDEDFDVMRGKYVPLLETISEDLGIAYELTIPEDYDSFLKSFNSGQFDLAHFGGYTFALAHEASGAVPLVQRDIDSRFTSYFITKVNKTSQPAGRRPSIRDCQGKVLAFASEMSTSGHLMPRIALEDQGIDPEAFFSEVRYSGSHDATIVWVREGEVDVGAVNSQIFNSLIDAHVIKADEFHILSETPPYANYVWAVQPSLGEADRVRIRDAFLNLSRLDEGHAQILDAHGANMFLPADIAAYGSIVKLARETGS